MRDKKYLELKAFKYSTSRINFVFFEFKKYETFSKEIAKIAIEKNLSVQEAYKKWGEPPVPYRMKKKFVYKEFIHQGWTNEELLKLGYMEEIKND